MGVVVLEESQRLRLFYRDSGGELSAVVANQWRDKLRLELEEFDALGDGTLNGDAALELIRERYQL